MTRNLRHSSIAPAQLLIYAVGGLDLTVGCLSAIGRVLGVNWMKISFGTQHPMGFNAALLFSAIGLWLAAPPKLTPVAAAAVRVASGVGLLLSGAIFLETLLGLDLGIDWPSLHGQFFTDHPGRLAWHTAFALMLLFGSIFLCSAKSFGVRPLLSGAAFWLAALAALTGGFGLVGYALDLDAFYSWFGVIKMAMPTALLLMVSGAAIAARVRHLGKFPASSRTSDKRIVGVSAGLLVCVAILSVGTGIAALEHASLDNTEVDLMQIASANENAVQTALSSARSSAVAVAADPNLAAALSAGGQQRANALSKLLSSSQLTRATGWASVEDVDGRLVAGTGQPPVEHLSVPLSGSFLGSRLVWTEGVALVSDFPIERQGARLGTIRIAILLPELDKLLSSRSRSTDETLLCGERSDMLQCFPSASIPYAHEMAALNGAFGRYPVARAIEGERGVRRVDDFSKRGVVAAFLPVTDTGLGLVQKIDVSEIYSTLDSRLGLAVGVPILGIVFALLLLRWTVQPVVARIVTAEREAQAARLRLVEAEKRLRSVTDNIPIRIAYLAADGVLTFANKAFAEFAGKPLDWIIGRTYKEALGDTYFEHTLPFFEKGLQGEASHYERRMTEHGRDDTHDVSYQPDFDDEGNVRGLYGMSYDITALKHAQRDLVAKEKHFRAITDNLPAIVAYIGADERYRSMNAGIAQVGLRPEDFIGRSMGEMLARPDYMATRPYVEKVLSGDRCRSEGEIVIRGKHYFHRTEYVPDMADDGSVKGFFVMALDVTEQKSIELDLRRSEENLRLLVEGVVDYSIIMLDPFGFVASWNTGAHRIKGYEAEEILGRHMSEFYLPEAAADGAPARMLIRATEAGNAQDEGWRVRKSGERFWAVVSISALRNEDGELRGFSQIVRDRTETRRAEQALKAREHQLRTITDHVPVLICYIDRSHVFRFNNAEYVRWLRKPLEEITNRPVREVYGEDVYFQLLEPLERALAGETMKFEASFQGWDGSTRISRGTYVPDVSESGAVVGVHGLIRDVTNTRRAERELIRAAETDVLTALPNRKKLTALIRKLLETGFEEEPFAALMFLDLDHFKRVNDEFGHQVGDEVLKEFGRRIRGALRPTDVVGRLGGDEFVVLLTSLNGPAGAQFAARKILAAMSSPFKCDGRTLSISTSIGIAQRAKEEREVSLWLKRADEALYQAKDSGRNGFKSM